MKDSVDGADLREYGVFFFVECHNNDLSVNESAPAEISDSP